MHIEREEIVRVAELAGFNVDKDKVFAPAAGRFGLDPRLIRFYDIMAESILSKQKASWYREGCDIGRRVEKERCALLAEGYIAPEIGKEIAAAIRRETE